jgi:hypothetical protein
MIQDSDASNEKEERKPTRKKLALRFWHLLMN